MHFSSLLVGAVTAYGRGTPASFSLISTGSHFSVHVYLGKPTTPGKQDEKPLLISDFFDAYSGSMEPEEQEIGTGGGAQVIVGAFKQKTAALENITLSQWMGEAVKILNSQLLHNNLDRNLIQDYLAYISRSPS